MQQSSEGIKKFSKNPFTRDRGWMELRRWVEGRELMPDAIFLFQDLLSNVLP